MHRLYPAWSCLAAAVALMIAGCASFHPKKPKPPKGFPSFNVIRLYNESPTEIYDLELTAGGTMTALDHLPPDHSPVSDRGVSPDPETVLVKWRSGQGSRFEQTVPIAKDLPPGFHGVIVLRLMESGDVLVKFISYAELR